MQVIQMAWLLAVVAVFVAVRWLRQRAILSLGKERSLAGHARVSRALARFVPYYEFAGERFFDADQAPREVVAARHQGFARLTASLQPRYRRSSELARDLAASLADLEFTARYRVPFQFSRHVRENLPGGLFVESEQGPQLTDLDGNRLYDLAGSYGVNLLGYDFYRRAIDRGVDRVRALGPVLGFLHPLVARNVVSLKRLSGHDSVSFHMSGTEAVMQAVRLARYHTRRAKIVRFAGAYHGWWGDVQPGVGNPLDADQTFTLKDLSDKALRVLRQRRDIACVLVNPLQALHPNKSAPGDNSLVDAGATAGFDRDAYGRWLRRLREVCTERGIVLIFDEVFVGFRLARGGAQEYFDVRADLVTYGKSLGGGLPVGVVCGRGDLMRRYRADRPADVCLARGTFNSHPYVMGAMAEFLEFIESDAAVALYKGLDARWAARAQAVNERLTALRLPVRIASLSSIWTINYLTPSRYNWMLQFYLRDAGLALSWIGTGRFIFPINLPDHDFDAIVRRLVDAAAAMQRDGWFWAHPETTNQRLRQRMLREMLQARWGLPWSGSKSSPRSKAAGALR